MNNLTFTSETRTASHALSAIDLKNSRCVYWWADNLAKGQDLCLIGDGVPIILNASAGQFGTYLAGDSPQGGKSKLCRR